MLGPFVARGHRYVTDVAVAVGTRLVASILITCNEWLREAVGTRVREVEEAVLPSAALKDGLVIVVSMLIRASGRAGAAGDAVTAGAVGAPAATAAVARAAGGGGCPCSRSQSWRLSRRDGGINWPLLADGCAGSSRRDFRLAQLRFLVVRRHEIDRHFARHLCEERRWWRSSLGSMRDFREGTRTHASGSSRLPLLIRSIEGVANLLSPIRSLSIYPLDLLDHCSSAVVSMIVAAAVGAGGDDSV